MQLLLKTDDKLARIAMYSGRDVAYEVEWQAHRDLSDTILIKIKEGLDSLGLSYQDIEGAGVYSGPGSFTGLRIGHTLVNTLGYSLDIPVASAGGEDWESDCLSQLLSNPDSRNMLAPDYGREARITKQRK